MQENQILNSLNENQKPATISLHPLNRPSSALIKSTSNTKQSSFRANNFSEYDNSDAYSVISYDKSEYNGSVYEEK